MLVFMTIFLSQWTSKKFGYNQNKQVVLTTKLIEFVMTTITNHDLLEGPTSPKCPF